jgi:hypothetical protein
MELGVRFSLGCTSSTTNGSIAHPYTSRVHVAQAAPVLP